MKRPGSNPMPPAGPKPAPPPGPPKTNMADALAIAATKLLIQSIDTFESELDSAEKAHVEKCRVQLDQGKPLSRAKAKALQVIHSRRLDALKYSIEKKSL